MKRDSYLLRAAEGEELDTTPIINEAMHEIGTALGETINSFHPADLPLMIAALELYAETLKNQLSGSGLELLRAARNGYSAVLAYVPYREANEE